VIVVVDAGVLIAHLETSAAHHDAATQRLLGIAGSELAASVLTVGEVLAGPARTGRVSEAQAQLDVLAVRQIAPGSDAATRLALLRARTGLKLPGCCVLLAAGDAAAQCIATFDDRLAKAALASGLTVPERGTAWASESAGTVEDRHNASTGGCVE